MATSAGMAPAHRSVATIRGGGSSSTPAGPVTPNTPPRSISQTYGSPSTLRADEDIVVVQLGSRFIRAGFAGEALPKATLQCGLEEQRRTGDFSRWSATQAERNSVWGWASEREIWRHDLKDVDLGLVQDKLDRVLREAFTKYLLIDSRPRRMGLVLDPELPLPLLSSLLDLLFSRFQAPMVSLLSSPVTTIVGAGVRSGLVIDLGWQETVVTSVYEYREVRSTRSIRGGRSLLNELDKTLCAILGAEVSEDEKEERKISFEECEEVLCRFAWCRSSAWKSSQRQSAQLETVEEQDEEADAGHQAHPTGDVTIPFASTTPPSQVKVPFEKLADACDTTFFSPGTPAADFDDHELPVHVLAYQHLLQLPVDVRATCMSRIVFTGGCANILGLKERIFDETSSIADRRGWEPVTGKAVEQLRNNPKLQRPATSVSNHGDSSTAESSPVESSDGATANQPNANDLIEAKLARRAPQPQMQGQMRALHSVGPWAGASLLCQLKVGAIATVDREQWLQHGIHGATRPGEVDLKVQQRQSMGGSGLWKGGGGHHGGSWTLGAWGYT